MAQESKFYKLSISGIIVNLENTTIYAPNTTILGVNAPNGAILINGRLEFLAPSEYALIEQAQFEYGDFEAKVKKGLFIFGQELTPTYFITQIICQLLQKFNCGCNDTSSTPPAENPSEPMLKTNPSAVNGAGTEN